MESSLGAVSSWQSLPFELKVFVLQFLPAFDLVRCTRVNHEFQYLIKNQDHLQYKQWYIKEPTKRSKFGFSDATEGFAEGKTAACSYDSSVGNLSVALGPDNSTDGDSALTTRHEQEATSIDYMLNPVLRNLGFKIKRFNEPTPPMASRIPWPVPNVTRHCVLEKLGDVADGITTINAPVSSWRKMLFSCPSSPLVGFEIWDTKARMAKCIIAYLVPGALGYDEFHLREVIKVLDILEMMYTPMRNPIRVRFYPLDFEAFRDTPMIEQMTALAYDNESSTDPTHCAVVALEMSFTNEFGPRTRKNVWEPFFTLKLEDSGILKCASLY
ncbi:MAG: hypothetical protein M1820_007947 [Bogoriella megaspora]|nr:MAG: hypothetical protein M1820_007947 [Bogoriella megaspora]